MKIWKLKDEYLKHLDLNYYINSKDKSDAQKYILKYKKDIVRIFNYFYYNGSELTFEFFNTVYEKIFLNKNNLKFYIKIVEKLLNEEKILN